MNWLAGAARMEIPAGDAAPGGAVAWVRRGYLSPSISHMSRAVMYVPPCAWHICVAVFAFGVPGLHVLPEYVPPVDWQIFADRSRIVLEHDASGSASKATMA